ncbi:MAG TPA: S8 family serine peptidase [Pseudogracilibacillus sp.]|nr:S8 family serine peptidase [Pseudogracilibacillus sp.]
MTLKSFRLGVLLLFFIFHTNFNLFAYPSSPEPLTEQKKQAVIIEVEGDPYKMKKTIEVSFPQAEVITIYDELLQGIGLKLETKDLTKLWRTEGVKTVHPASTYVATLQPWKTKSIYDQKTNLSKKELQSLKSDASIAFPSELNNTKFTGKGIKVGVIDTGIDFFHPDLKRNYKGGFDLVDLDDEPYETTEKEGEPTTHGTHVAGIIGANGLIKGVAPDAELYAYRALGPGGVGSSIHVIAAMEQALKDGVDIMNLSLGNSINGPDYPTSKAVVEASKQGIAVIVANGNSGPNDWTIGAPATASTAFSVGAYTPIQKNVYLYEPISKKEIPLQPLPIGTPWELDKDYKIEFFQKGKDLTNRIAFLSLEEVDDLFTQIEAAKEQNAEAILIEQKEGFVLDFPPIEHQLDIPIALVKEKDGHFLARNKASRYFHTKITTYENLIAPFSSRGPVTLNWQIKPNVVAPGVNVFSTVPKGYDLYNGTSMAAPHVAGAVALVKEAHPEWTTEQIFASLETTAHHLTEQTSTNYIAPFIQGAGLIDPKKAIEAEVLIENGLLTFGKTETLLEKREHEVTFHNVTNQEKTVVFSYPKKSAGLKWDLPKNLTIKPNTTVTVPITVHLKDLFLDEGLHDGLITIHIDEESYDLPYIFINRTESYEKIAGFSFSLNEVTNRDYTYSVYAVEELEWLEVQLYEPDTLFFVNTLMKIDDLTPGMNEGEVRIEHIKEKGFFYGLVLAKVKDGEIVNLETPIYIE